MLCLAGRARETSGSIRSDLGDRRTPFEPGPAGNRRVKERCSKNHWSTTGWNAFRTPQGRLVSHPRGKSPFSPDHPSGGDPHHDQQHQHQESENRCCGCATRTGETRSSSSAAAGSGSFFSDCCCCCFPISAAIPAVLRIVGWKKKDERAGRWLRTAEGQRHLRRFAAARALWCSTGEGSRQAAAAGGGGDEKGFWDSVALARSARLSSTAQRPRRMASGTGLAASEQRANGHTPRSPPRCVRHGRGASSLLAARRIIPRDERPQRSALSRPSRTFRLYRRVRSLPSDPLSPGSRSYTSETIFGLSMRFKIAFSCRTH